MKWVKTWILFDILHYNSNIDHCPEAFVAVAAKRLNIRFEHFETIIMKKNGFVSRIRLTFQNYIEVSKYTLNRRKVIFERNVGNFQKLFSKQVSE